MQARVYIDFRDRATEPLQRQMAALTPERVGKVCGPRLREKVRDHLKRNPRNRRGWPSTGFWEDAARGTTWTSDSSSVRVLVNKIGVRQRYYGGPIRPVAKDALTIPISAQAYGKTVADFPGAFLLRTRKGAYIVQYSGAPTGRRRQLRGALQFLFKLSKGVVQKENRAIIPTEVELVATALGAMEKHFARVKGGAA